MSDKYFAVDKGTLQTGWDRRHNAAMISPKGVEVGIVAMLNGLEAYIEDYEQRFEGSIFHDSVLGADGIVQIAKGIRVLLNGELGRLDAGTIDTRLCEVLKACGELV